MSEEAEEIRLQKFKEIKRLKQEIRRLKQENRELRELIENLVVFHTDSRKEVERVVRDFLFEYAERIANSEEHIGLKKFLEEKFK